MTLDLDEKKNFIKLVNWNSAYYNETEILFSLFDKF